MKTFFFNSVNVAIILLLSFMIAPAGIAAEFVSAEDVRHVTDRHYSAGQPDKEVLSTLAEQGVKHVINLRPSSETPEFNEESIVTELNMTYHNLPISGPADLTRDNVSQLNNLLKEIGDDKVLLHCSSGNRVGALMALRAAWISGASPDEALAEGKRYGLTRLQPAVEELLAK